MKELLTVPEAAAYVKRSTRTIYRWVAEGRLREAPGASEIMVERRQVLKVAGVTRRGRPKGSAKKWH